MGCLFAVFGLVWKIVKTAGKIAWKILRVVLFGWGLIFTAVYMLGAFILDLIYKIGLNFTGEMRVWYWVGLALSIICSGIVFVRRATKK